MSLLSATDKLRTLELYLRHQSLTVVAQVLGISTTGVRCRLVAMGVVMRPPGNSKATVRSVNGQENINTLRAALTAAVVAETGKPPLPLGPDGTCLPTPDFLRAERLRQGLTQCEVARRVGVSQPVISRLETGQYHSEALVWRYADVLRDTGR